MMGGQQTQVNTLNAGALPDVVTKRRGVASVVLTRRGSGYQGASPEQKGKQQRQLVKVPPQSRGAVTNNACQWPWLTAELTLCEISGLDQAVLLRPRLHQGQGMNRKGTVP